MRYRDIMEAAPDAEANARRTQQEKLAAANDKAAKASQTYQNTLKVAHDSAAAARRKLSTPPKPPAPPKPVAPGWSMKPLQTLSLGTFRRGDVW
jgi:hypothetical protein